MLRRHKLLGAAGETFAEGRLVALLTEVLCQLVSSFGSDAVLLKRFKAMSLRHDVLRQRVHHPSRHCHRRLLLLIAQWLYKIDMLMSIEVAIAEVTDGVTNL